MATLVHVATIESNAHRYLPGDAIPDWVTTGEAIGSFTLRPWDDAHIMAIMRVKMVGDQHAVVVSIGGLYRLTADDPMLPGTDEQNRHFYTEHATELEPFLRQAVHTASAMVWPINPILLSSVDSPSQEEPLQEAAQDESYAAHC